MKCLNINVEEMKVDILKEITLTMKDLTDYMLIISLFPPKNELFFKIKISGSIK